MTSKFTPIAVIYRFENIPNPYPDNIINAFDRFFEDFINERKLGFQYYAKESLFRIQLSI